MKKHCSPFHLLPGAKPCWALITALLLYASGAAQPGADWLRTRFQQYRQQTLQEKIYAHLDKSFYVTGEVLWLKLYLVDGYIHRPLREDKVAYVEVIGGSPQPVLQAKIKMTAGTGDGALLLPATVASGHYYVRVYTAWMKNFGPGSYFEKRITVVNTVKRLPAQKAGAGPEDRLQFFPEGGHLVAGLPAKVAFRCTDSLGKGTAGRGYVLDGRDTVARFQTVRLGMGFFAFTPQAGRQYRAVVHLEGRLLAQPLPPVAPKGYALQVRPEEGQLAIAVQVSAGLEDSVVYLFAHTRQSVKAVLAQGIRNGRADFRLDKSILGEGISHLTLFNGARQPVCERLVFEQPRDRLNIALQADRPAYGLREKVTLDLQAQNLGGAPQAADLSLAVFRTDSLQPPDQEDMAAWLWLSSDLQGSIEDAAYYLQGGAEAAAAADLLMLTQGWRRFRWADVLQEQQPAFRFLPEYEGQLLTGRVTDQRTGLPAPGITTFFSLPGPQFQMQPSTTDARGLAYFAPADFYQHRQLVVQAGGAADSPYRFELFHPYDDRFSGTMLPELALPASWRDELTERSIQAQVQQAYGHTPPAVVPRPGDNTAFYGRPDKTYLLDDYTRFATLEEVMREYVPEVRVRRQNNNFHFQVANAPALSFFDHDPLVLVDGLPVFDMNRVMALDPLKIRKMEVVTRPYHLGPVLSSGIVSYSTYDGSVPVQALNPAAVVVALEGLQARREFNAAVYESSAQRESRLPDFRTLLHWAPFAGPDATGRQQLSFYTSDVAGQYAVVVQGMTANGLAGTGVLTFTVHE